MSKKLQFVQNKEIIFNEYIIEPDIEQLHVTKMYYKQSGKIYGKKRLQKALAEQSKTDDDDELVDNMYIAENFGTG